MAASDGQQPLTEWLRVWQRQSNGARLDERVLQAVYSELRAVAAQRLAQESQSPLTPTELVHETWLRLKPSGAPITDRRSFLRLASVAMRHLLVDQARRRLSQKRQVALRAVTVSLAADGTSHLLDDAQWLDLGRALDALADDHPRAAEAVTLRAFAGLELDELAQILRISLATAKRDLAFGRAWLAARLGGAAP